MCCVSHPLAYLMRPNFIPTDLGVIIRAASKVVWARNTSNQTIHNYYDIRVYENVWTRICNVTCIGVMQFEDHIYELFDRDKIDNILDKLYRHSA